MKARDLEFQSLREIAGRVLELAVKNPTAAEHAARRCLDSPEGLRRLAAVAHGVGITYAPLVFTGVSASEWRFVEHCLQESLTAQPAEWFKRRAHELLESLANEVGELSDADDSSINPFEFLSDCAAESRNALLSRQSPADLALLSAYWPPSEVANLLGGLAPTVRKETVLQIVRLSRLPAEARRKAARRFAQALATESEALATPQPESIVPAPPAIERSVLKGLQDRLAIGTERALMNQLRQQAPELFRSLGVRKAAVAASANAPASGHVTAPASAPRPVQPPPFLHRR